MIIDLFKGTKRHGCIDMQLSYVPARTNASSVPGYAYVAMGGSYSFGEGASSFENGTFFGDPSTGGTTGCHRPQTAWANKVAAAESLSRADWAFVGTSGS